MLCAKFCSNWPSCFGGGDFSILSMYFRYFVIISPWKRAWPFIWTNLDLLHTRMFCAKCFWRRFLNFINVFSLLSPPGKGPDLSFEQTSIPFAQECFVPSLVEICRVILEKKKEMWKIYVQMDKWSDRQMDRLTTDDRRSEKLLWFFFNSGELKMAKYVWLFKVCTRNTFHL